MPLNVSPVGAIPIHTLLQDAFRACIFSFCASIGSRFPQAKVFQNCGKVVDFQKVRASRPMNIWKQVLDRLEQDIDRTEYVTWFAPTRFLAQKRDTLDVSVPSQRFVDAIRERYSQQLRNILGDVATDRLNLRFITDAVTAFDLSPVPISTATEVPISTSIFNPWYRFTSS